MANLIGTFFRGYGTFFKGFAMGTADVVPGFSGGTVALLTGIYEKLVGFLSELAKLLAKLLTKLLTKLAKSILKTKSTSSSTSEPTSEPNLKAQIQELDWGFALTLGAGIAAAIFSLANLLEFLLRDYPEAMAGLFLGLILGTLLNLLLHIQDKRPQAYIGAACIGGLFFWLLGFQADSVSNPNPFIFLGSGVLAAVAMILPGISGSFILLILGMYSPVVNALSDFEILNLLFLAVGVGAGLLLFSTALNALFQLHRVYVLTILCGLMLGSARILWPWPDGVGLLDRQADQVIDGTGLELPQAGEIWLPAVLALAGLGVVWLLSRRVEILEGK